MNARSNFYSQPSSLSAFRIYSGARRQRGGGFLGSARNFMAPVGKSVFSAIKSTGKFIAPAGKSIMNAAKAAAKSKLAKDIAKKTLQKSVEVAGSVAVDALQGRDVNEAIKERSREAALQTLVGNPPPKRRSVKRKLKQRKKRPVSIVSAPLQAVKRSSSTASKVTPPSKRRRITASSRAKKNRANLF